MQSKFAFKQGLKQELEHVNKMINAAKAHGDHFFEDDTKELLAAEITALETLKSAIEARYDAIVRSGIGTELASFTVTFDSRGGTKVDPVEAFEGSVVAKPVDPTKSGFIFEGWFTTSELTTEYDFSTPVTSDITLYAKWASAKPSKPTTVLDFFQNKVTLGVQGQKDAEVEATVTVNDEASEVITGTMSADGFANLVGTKVLKGGDEVVVSTVLKANGLTSDADVQTKSVPMIAPVLTANLSSDNKPHLTWTGDGELFMLETYSTGMGGWVQAYSGDQHEFTETDPGIEPGEHKYRVKATAPVEGPLSNEATVTVPAVKPEAPVLTSANDTDGKPLLTWTEVPSVDSYALFRDTKASMDDGTPVYTGNELTFKDATAEVETTYYYAVAAVRGELVSADSNIEEVTVTSPA